MPESSLRDRLAEALRTAAFLCDDSCTLEDEAVCDAAHPIQVTCLHFDQVADITGPVDDIADAMAAVVQAELDAKDRQIEKLAATIHAFPDAHNAANLAHARAERDRLAVEIRGLEEAAAEQQQNAVRWQERAERVDLYQRQHVQLLDDARAYADRTAASGTSIDPVELRAILGDTTKESRS